MHACHAAEPKVTFRSICGEGDHGGSGAIDVPGEAVVLILVALVVVVVVGWDGMG